MQNKVKQSDWHAAELELASHKVYHTHKDIKFNTHIHAYTHTHTQFTTHTKTQNSTHTWTQNSTHTYMHTHTRLQDDRDAVLYRRRFVPELLMALAYSPCAFPSLQPHGRLCVRVCARE